MSRVFAPFAPTFFNLCVVDNLRNGCMRPERGAQPASSSLIWITFPNTRLKFGNNPTSGLSWNLNQAWFRKCQSTCKRKHTILIKSWKQSADTRGAITHSSTILFQSHSCQRRSPLDVLGRWSHFPTSLSLPKRLTWRIIQTVLRATT